LYLSPPQADHLPGKPKLFGFSGADLIRVIREIRAKYGYRHGFRSAKLTDTSDSWFVVRISHRKFSQRLSPKADCVLGKIKTL